MTSTGSFLLVNDKQGFADPRTGALASGTRISIGRLMLVMMGMRMIRHPIICSMLTIALVPFYCCEIVRKGRTNERMNFKLVYGTAIASSRDHSGSLRYRYVA
jgi:hypothetical protein